MTGRRSFTVEYDSGVATAERMLATQGKDILPWRGGQASTENGDNFVRNQVTVADVADIRAAGGRNALGLSAVWACVNLLAGTIASLPLMVYRTDDKGVRSVARNHPLYRLLHDSPNYDDTAADFWEFAVAGLELQGNAYARISRSASGGFAALIPIRPDIVKARRLPGGDIEYSYTADGQKVTLANRDVLHIRGPLGNALSGTSTLTACRGSFDAAVSTDAAAAAVFANGVRPSGILSAGENVALKKEQRDEIEGLLHEKFVGAMKAGRPMLLDRGMKWQQLDLNPEDAQMLESRRFGVEEICRIFGVPPHMVGHTENSTSWGTGLEQQTLGFVKFSLRRRLKRIEQALEKQLLTDRDRAEGVTIEFNLEGLLRGDSAGRSSFYQSALSNGWMTINEVRRLENLPPVPGGDEPRMQLQNVPITATGQPVEE